MVIHVHRALLQVWSMVIHVHRALLSIKKGKKGTEEKKTRKEIHQTTTQSTDLNTELQQLRKINRSMKFVMC